MKNDDEKATIMMELYNHIMCVFAENDISKIEATGILHAFIFKIELETQYKIQEDKRKDLNGH